MTGAELQARLRLAMPTLSTAASEVGALDATVGDGDLGVTLAASCTAVARALDTLEAPSPTHVVRTVAEALASANPSTLSTLLAAALASQVPSMDGVEDLDRAAALRLGDGVAAAIGRLGRSGPGDKTVLDPLLASLDAVRSAGGHGDPLAIATDAARASVAAIQELEPRRGRAAWQGERAIGHPDPGAVAFLRFLEAVATVGDR